MRHSEPNWFFMGILSTLCFAFYGFFGKLSEFQHPLVTNLIIYATASICGIPLIIANRRGFRFSKSGFLSGVASNIGAIIMLYTLISNQVLVVFSFVSFASVIFFLVILAIDKPRLSPNQKLIATVGVLVAAFGLFLASTSTAGGIRHVLNNPIVSWQFLLLAPIMPLSFGCWAYFSFVAIKKNNENVSNICLNYSLASLTVASTAYLLFRQTFPMADLFMIRNLYPILAGMFVLIGVGFTLKSYEFTSGQSRIEETMVAILANAEIIPLIFLSYFILKEITIEGFAGALTVFIGLSILNSARTK